MTKKYDIPTIGCDPEIFIRSPEGHFVPSCGKFGGTKKEPRIIAPEIGLGILEDNVTLEFNMNPAKTHREFRDMLGQAGNSIYGLVNGMGFNVYCSPQAQFAPEALAAFPQAMIFGCDPDNEAFKHGEERIAPTPEALGTWRCAGHHLHFGWTPGKYKIPKWAIVMYLEAFAALWDPQMTQSDGVRRQFYGLPGLFRDKPYGVEWRTPASWVGGYFTGLPPGGIYLPDIAQTVVAGVLADEKRARTMFDFIDWPKVQRVLSMVYKSSTKDAFTGLRNELQEFRDEILERGKNVLADANGDEPDPAQVLREANRGQRPQFLADAPALIANG